MSMQMMKFMLSQNVSVLRETMKKTNALSGVELPENLVDLMYETMSAQGGETVQLVSVRDVLQSAIPLPFMPDRIDYKIGKGCCDEIVKCDGLFIPCSKQCDGDKCAKHLKTPTGFGNYWDRHAAWSKHELYCVVIPEKEVKGAIVKEKELKEKTYGTYLHSKKLDSAQVAEELSKWGVSLQLDPSLFRAPAKPLKKSRGRKAEKKVASTESDDEQEEESEKSGDSQKSGTDESQKSEGEVSEDEEEKPKEIKKKPVKVKEPKAPKEPKVKAVKEPKVKPVKEPKVAKAKAPKVKEPEPDSDDEDDMTIAQMTMAQLAAKAQACGLESDDEDEPIVVEDELEEPSDDEEEPTAVQEAESDDEDLSMLSKAKKPEVKPEPKPEPKPEVKKEKPKTEKPKSKTEKEKPVRARSSSPELKKEKMEKAPKKGAIYNGKKESMSEVVCDDETYLFKDGRYYNPESLELIAWDNKGEFELL